MKEYLVNDKIFRLNVFSKISNDTEAYLIGYLLGDGIYNKGNHKRQERMGVSSSDNGIIEKFKEIFCPDSSIDSRIPVNKKRNIKSNKISYKITFSSRFSEAFKSFGILELKENRTYTNISKKYMPALLKGLIDSDGCISFGKRKDRDRFWAYISITHSSFNMLTKLQTFLEKELNISSSIKPKGKEHCYVFKINSLNNCKLFIEYIQKYSGSISIERKNKLASTLCHLIGLKQES